MDVGAVADWFAGGVALVALAFAGSAWRREGRRADEVARRQRSAQADQVTCWIADESSAAVDVRIRNGSRHPINEVLIVSFRRSEAGMTIVDNEWVGTVAPESDAAVNVAPGDVHLFFADAQRMSWTRTDRSLESYPATPSLWEDVRDAVLWRPSRSQTRPTWRKRLAARAERRRQGIRASGVRSLN